MDEFKKNEDKLKESKVELAVQVLALKAGESSLQKQLLAAKESSAQLEGEVIAHRQQIDTANETILIKVTQTIFSGSSLIQK